MKVELTAEEIGFILGLITNYSKSHPYNVSELKIGRRLGHKLLDSVHNSSKQTNNRSQSE